MQANEKTDAKQTPHDFVTVFSFITVRTRLDSNARRQAGEGQPSTIAATGKDPAGPRFSCADL